MTEQDDVFILVVDDEPEVADVYTLQLRQAGYDAEAAYGGEEALETVTDDVDVVLLDRRMPLSGDDVLDEIRERGFDCRVIMVTAVSDPDFDIVDMPFDDYLCKPVEKDDLLATIEQQLDAREYDEGVDEFFRVSSKIGILEAEKTPEELAGSEEYQQLKARAEELRDDTSDQVAGFEDAIDAFEAIDRGS